MLKKIINKLMLCLPVITITSSFLTQNSFCMLLHEDVKNIMSVSDFNAYIDRQHKEYIKGSKKLHPVIDFYYSISNLRHLCRTDDINYCNGINNIKLLIKKYKKVCLKATNEKGQSLLILTCKDSIEDLAKFILNEFDDQNLVNAADNCGKTPLYYACKNKMWTLAAELIKRGATNFKDEDGQTPLIFACAADQKDLIKLILDKAKATKKLSAIINEKDYRGYTPIFWACVHKNWDLVITLLAHCTKETIESLGEIPNDIKSSCLEIACQLNAPVNIIQELTTTKTINLKNKLNEAPLYYAFENNNIKAVKFLLSKGAYLDAELLGLSRLKKKLKPEKSNPETFALLEAVQLLDKAENKIELLKNIKETENSNELLELLELLIKRTICLSIECEDTLITENHLLANLFNDKEIGIQKILNIKVENLYSFIEKINKKMKLNIDEKRYAGLEYICLICRENSSKETITLPCHNTHIFCKECIEEWLKDKTTCPICRSEVTIDYAFQNKDWDLAVKFLATIEPELINLTKNPYSKYLDIAIESKQDKIIKLLLAKNTNLLTKDNNIYITEENKDQDYNKLLCALDTNNIVEVNLLLKKLLQQTLTKNNKKKKNKVKSLQTKKAQKKQTIQDPPKYIIRIKNNKSKNTQDTFEATLNTTHGWIKPTSDNAKAAMELVKRNPENGRILDNVIMSDRGHKDRDGWKKVIQVIYHINGNILNEPIEIHYNLKTIPTKNESNVNIYETDHFKFKNYLPQDLTIYRQKTFKGENINN